MIYSELPSLSKHNTSSDSTKLEVSMPKTGNPCPLQQVVDKLQRDKERLGSEVSNLKQLISRLSKEHKREAEDRLTSYESLAEDLNLAKQSQKAAEENAGVLDDIRDFWSEMLSS